VIQLVDCHAHLHDSAFDSDRAEVLMRARESGVASIVTSGTDVATSAAAVALAEHEASVWATVGIHPHDAAASSAADVERLSFLAASDRVVAIGEIGLDYHYNHSPHDVQRQRLEQQLDLARALNLPVVIHSRDADDDTFAILSAWGQGSKTVENSVPAGVMHCYSYGPARAEDYVSLGFVLSLPGIVTYPNAASVRDVAAVRDLDHLVVETDCPYLAPQSRRGRRNEPAFVGETAARLAEVRGMSLDDVAARTTANARRLFGLPDRQPVLHSAGDGNEAASL
jgi:TatD DNase family protein